jgi:glycosyltransferase involved in cell wall biosynthesis
MKVAVVVGVVVRHDAISSAALEQIATLQSLPEVEEVVLFTQGLEPQPLCNSYVLGSPWELLRHPAFRECDVAIFHWGIYFVLFDAITLLRPPQLPAPVVHFHNCTPPSLVEEAQREQIVRSIDQLHHMIALDIPLWTYSEFNRRTLIDWGALDGQVAWVTFPIPSPGRQSRRRRDDDIHLLSVGRLVPAKGVHVLIDALTLLPDTLLERVWLRVVSSKTFSSDGYRDLLDEKLHNSRPLAAKSVEFLASPSDDVLAAVYCDTDVVISTSFHEGLCVPVIEGYATGCRAIGTTAANLPYVVFPPDPVVPPGDPIALAAAIESVATDLVVDDPIYHRRCRELVDSFSPRVASQTLSRALADVLERRRA